MSRLNRIRLLVNEHGAAVIEMALIAPVLALGVIGIVDVSNAYSRKLALEQGAQRAVEKIMNTTENASVESTLTNEVQCQVNGSTTTTASATYDALVAACTSPSIKAGYVQVTVTDKYSPMFPIHFAAFNTTDSTYHIAATAGVRTL